jgi:hypothetical protein
VKRSETNEGTEWPRRAERTVMTMSAEKAAENTSSRGCRMAIRAATRNVLSPISEKMIMVNESINEWNGCMTPPASSPGRFEAGVFDFGVVVNGFLSDSASGLGCGMLCGLSGILVGFCKLVNHHSNADVAASPTSRPTAPSARELVSAPKISLGICLWSP